MQGRHRVLLIEDELDARQNLQSLLQSRGYLVDTAENGLQALEMLREYKKPDIVLLDLEMPIMTGWEFCVELRKHERLADLPIVIISGRVGIHADIPSTIAQMSKPVDLHLLCRIIEKHRSIAR